MKSALTEFLARRKAMLRVDAAAAGVIIGLSASAYLALIRPVWTSEAAAASDASRLVDQRTRAQQLNSTLISLRAERDAARRMANGKVPNFSDAGEVNERLAKLAELAASSGVQIDTMEPHGKPLQTASFTVTEIAIGGHGSYACCTRFISALHDAMGDATVASMDLSSPVPGEPASLNLTLNWYAAPSGAGAR